MSKFRNGEYGKRINCDYPSAMDETWVVAEGLSRPELRLWCAYADVASAGVRQRGPFERSKSGNSSSENCEWSGFVAPPPPPPAWDAAAAAAAEAGGGTTPRPTGSSWEGTGKGKGKLVLLAPARTVVEDESVQQTAPCHDSQPSTFASTTTTTTTPGVGAAAADVGGPASFLSGNATDEGIAPEDAAADTTVSEEMYIIYIY